MNRDEILAMPAGREMDRLIAVRIFGWTDFGVEYSPRFQKVSKERDSVRVLYELPPYSTDIAAAWLVVEKMLETNVGLSWINTVGGWVWNFRIGGYHWATGDTAPLAICRASLLCMIKHAPE